MHVEYHEGNGPPVLLVHGIMAGRALWNANLDALKTVSSPVVVELYGHGRSSTPTNPERYHWASYVDEFEKIRIGLGADRWFVVGQSLGAALTMRYVFAHPSRVFGHVITNSVSAVSDRPPAPSELEAGARHLEARGHDALADHSLNPARSRRIVADVREALVADQRLLNPRGIAMAMRHTVRDVSSRDSVSTNRVPTLIVAGAREVAFHEPSEYLARQMPGATVQRIDSAGHSPNAETPEEFNRMVTEFLSDCLRPDPRGPIRDR
jgi:2-succinyl-6-hydroxy-2,4-cyclohexadiene-1-carboxylate synthase